MEKFPLEKAQQEMKAWYKRKLTKEQRKRLKAQNKRDELILAVLKAHGLDAALAEHKALLAR